MALWDLFSLVNQHPLLNWGSGIFIAYFGSSGVLSVRFAHSKSYQTFWYWGQLTSCSLSTLVFTARLPFSESFFYHSRMAMWIILFTPKGSFKQYFALVGVFGSIMALVHPVFLSLPFSSRFDQQCLYNPLGQLSNLSGSTSTRWKMGLFGRSVR